MFAVLGWIAVAISISSVAPSAAPLDFSTLDEKATSVAEIALEPWLAEAQAAGSAIPIYDNRIGRCPSPQGARPLTPLP